MVKVPRDEIVQMTNEEAQKILEELQSGKTVDPDKLREFFTAVAKEAKSAGKEVIPFEVMDTRYVLYAPLNSMCILAEIDVINKATEESTLHLLMMSVNMEHVNKLLELLRQKDPATVDAITADARHRNRSHSARPRRNHRP